MTPVQSLSPSISIIYVTKNGGDLFRQSLEAVFCQETHRSYEVIVIDSGSTDGTLELLKGFPVRLKQIAPEEFSHSRTRNLGATMAQASDYILFMNQDATPSDQYWLNNMINSIEYESDIKAVSAMELGRKQPFFNVSGVASYVYRNSAVKGVYVIEPHLLAVNNNLPALRRRELFPFSTVCAIFDKDHFNQYPFDEKIEWGEDLHWSVRNSNLGFKSACTSLAKVYHYHDYSKEELLQIAQHTAPLYKELFGIEFDAKQIALDLGNLGTCPACADRMAAIREIHSSLSWRITAPLRWLGNFFRSH